MLEAAIRQTQILQYQVGGMVAFVEAENKEKLLSFYENYGFKRFATFSFIRAFHCGLPFVMQKNWRFTMADERIEKQKVKEITDTVSQATL